LELLDLGPQAT